MARRTQSKTVTDITTLVAVQSLFEPGVKDPWGLGLAGSLADWYAYSESPKVILPRPAELASTPWEPPAPGILDELRRREAGALTTVPFHTGPPLTLREELYDDTLDAFVGWCRLNPRDFERWIELHKEKWANVGYSSRYPTRYLFDLRRVLEDRRVISLSHQLLIGREDLAYGLDVALRYPCYAELVGDRGVYLSHPLRETQQLPTMTIELMDDQPLALSFAADVSKLIPHLSLDEYCSLLHEMRAIVDHRGLRDYRAIDSSQIREIAADLNLPVQLKGWSQTTRVGAAILGVLAVSPKFALVQATLGVGALFYNGQLPHTWGSFKWARWAMHWPIVDRHRGANRSDG